MRGNGEVERKERRNETKKNEKIYKSWTLNERRKERRREEGEKWSESRKEMRRGGEEDE